MLARIRKSQEENEGGFTLIELLVVIIIIGILAAIAIPTFLNQREKGWKSAIKADIKNAATAMESYATDSNGAYVASDPAETVLGAEGFNATQNVEVVAALVDVADPAAGYTLVGTHDNLSGCTITFTSTTGQTVEAGC